MPGCRRPHERADNQGTARVVPRTSARPCGAGPVPSRYVMSQSTARAGNNSADRTCRLLARGMTRRVPPTPPVHANSAKVNDDRSSGVQVQLGAWSSTSASPTIDTGVVATPAERAPHPSTGPWRVFVYCGAAHDQCIPATIRTSPFSLLRLYVPRHSVCTADFCVFFFYRPTGRPRRPSLPLECSQHNSDKCRCRRQRRTVYSKQAMNGAGLRARCANAAKEASESEDKHDVM